MAIAALLIASGARVATAGARGRAAGPAVRVVASDGLAEARPVPRAPALALEPARGVTIDPRWALLVGVNDYPGTKNDLRTAVADVTTMRAALDGLGFPADHIRTLTNAGATARAVLEGARWLAGKVRAGQTGVFLFAGHAEAIPGDTDRDGEWLDEALVGTDMGPVTDGALADALRPARGSMWLVFATCLAAGFDDAAAPGRVLSFASKETAMAYESTPLHGSFLMAFLVRRAMLGEGISSVEAAERRAVGWMTGEWRRYRPYQLDRHPGPLSLVLRPAQAGV